MKAEYDARRERQQHRLAVDEYEVQAMVWEPCLACGFGSGETAGQPRSVAFGGRRALMAVVVCPGCGREA